MGHWTRARYQVNLPLYADREKVTAGKEHLELARRAAREGMVLLKNETGLLPLKSGSKVALFGKGTIDYVKGGGGNGDVTCAYTINLYEGLKQQENAPEIYEPLCDFYRENVQPIYAVWIGSGITEQFTIKCSTYNKETRSQIPNDFGYNVDRGNSVLIKLLDFYSKD